MSHSMKPWTSDAGNYLPSEESNRYIFQTRAIRKFLDIGDHEDQFFLIGPKGLGKTLLLRYKSYLYREHMSGAIKFAGGDQLTESLSVFYDTLSKDDLLPFKKLSHWEKIWMFSLLVVICRTADVRLKPEIEALVNTSSNISSMLMSFLAHRSRMREFTSHIPYLLGQISTIQSGVAVFIDNVDQAFQNILQEHHYTDYDPENGVKPAVEFWINAQLGLMQTMYNLNRANNHIKIFATFRSEAFIRIPLGMEQNYRSYATYLNYTKEEIKEIFINNIKLMDPEDWVDSGSSNFIQKFFGFEVMPHPFAKDPDGARRQETVFDFLYRHTYGRPREIVRLGDELFHRVISQPDYQGLHEGEKIERVRHLVNSISNEFFRIYKEEIIPRFEEEDLKYLLSNVFKNIIPRSNLRRLDPRKVNHFYNLGLIGYTREFLNSKELKQVFLPPATYNYAKTETIPDAPFYLTHPSLDKSFMTYHSPKSFYNRNNIIGEGGKFYDPRLIKYPLEYYLPVRVSGDRMEKPSEASKHQLALKEYYQVFFTSDHQEIESFRKQLMDEAIIILNLITQAYCCHLTGENHHDKRKELTQKLRELIPIEDGYQAVLGRELNLQTMKRFSHRLRGRMITLGCCLFLNLNLASIHKMFLEHYLDLHAFYDDSKYRYLRVAFFISGLVGDENSMSQEQKVLIHSSVSQFEAEMLREWWDTFPFELIYDNWLDPEEIQVLVEKLRSDINLPMD